MLVCKVTKMLSNVNMQGYKNTSTIMPTNAYIHGRLTIAINGYIRRYEKVTRLQKRSHLALQPFSICN